MRNTGPTYGGGQMLGTTGAQPDRDPNAPKPRRLTGQESSGWRSAAMGKRAHRARSITPQPDSHGTLVSRSRPVVLVAVAGGKPVPVVIPTEDGLAARRIVADEVARQRAALRVKAESGRTKPSVSRRESWASVANNTVNLRDIVG